MKKTNWKYDCNKQESKIDYKGFYEAIKNFMRNLGKTNRIYPREIREIINEFEEGEKI